MSTAPPGFEKALDVYLRSLAQPNSEAGRAYLFLEFSRSVFKTISADYLEKLFPVLEKHLSGKAKTLLVKGRIDAFLGNLIIEFKKILDLKSLQDAESELRRYVSILWTQQKGHRVSYIVIATDGDRFVSFRPRTAVEDDEVTPDEVFLDEIDKIVLTQTNPGAAFVWLDRYMLTATLRPATAQAFSNEFGLGKPAFNDAEAFLRKAWKSNEETVLYDQWAGFLRIVYGTDVHSQELFLRHTYLATLAKLLAYSSFSGGALPVFQDQIREILEGRVFEKWNIHNFLEEDFFSWVARSDEGVKAASALLERLASYDLSIIDEDILKALYQELVDPQARHDLGEYYTPDWLAEFIVARVAGDDPEKTILDPACGSGTFLAASIRHKKGLLKKKKPRQRLEVILRTVKGIDVHPLAVILSRTNFLASLGTELLSARSGPVSVPVYMADSIHLPELDIVLHSGVESFKIDAEKEILRLPLEVAKEPVLADQLIEVVKGYAKDVAAGEVAKLEDFENLLSQEANASLIENLNKGVPRVLFETARTMAELIKAKKDTVWAFILKNIYKPLFLRDQKFDLLIGNPPWLAYRFVESVDYQTFLKDLILKKYNLLGSERAELITQMELATLFFARSADLYLAKNGKISFVMPRGVFVGDQHHNFRQALYSPEMKFQELIDLEDVDPLFRMPSCVITAGFGKNTYPVDTLVLEGNLGQKNSKLDEAYKHLKQIKKKFQYYEIGQRSFLESEEFEKVLRVIEKGKRSHYFESFTQGATIVPRSVWFVEPVVHRMFGIDPTKPSLQTSQRAIDRAKEDYQDVRLKGEVESKFLFKVATGSELAPFCATTLPIAVLPIESDAGNYRIINSEEAQERGFTGLRNWLLEAEKVWETKRGEKADKMDLYAWLNYQNKLTGQSSRARYKVLYNHSGTYLVSCVLENKASTTKFDSSEIKLAGVITDVKAYGFDTSNFQEAMFVCAFLNAPIIDSLIKPMQSRGQWGARDIHKKVLELPIPKFDARDPRHIQLVGLAKEAQAKAEKLVPELETKYSGIAKIRQLIKVQVVEEVLKIDKIVRDLLSEAGNIPSDLDAFTQRK